VSVFYFGARRHGIAAVRTVPSAGAAGSSSGAITR
jgi:hypothetical protein